MRGAFYSWTEASAEGSVDMPQFPDTLSFHIVARGTAFLEVDGRAPFQLDAGKLALVPRGIGHRVSTSPGAPVLGRADLLPQTMLGDSFSILRIGPEDAAASARPAVRRGRVRLAGGARGARGAPARSSASTRPPHPMMAALLPAPGRRAARPAPWRRRRRHATRRRARRRDGASVARRSGGRRRPAGSRHCATAARRRPSPQCIARPATHGPCRRWQPAPRCHGRPSPPASPPSWERRRWHT